MIATRQLKLQRGRDRCNLSIATPFDPPTHPGGFMKAEWPISPDLHRLRCRKGRKTTRNTCEISVQIFRLVRLAGQ
ncbi:hypothetical protein LF1_43500 [Rubripirellula obstinata]|uniref:Uncharacterized protein n=1 Tax=Rubripirellula obstinata TaxID=406547 RepID=A0A5B1CQ81_9BACT|nr:hypothetical protein LF1_43500 [Rubripirellula obstinata]